jgi:hypothetical protein
MTQVVLCLGGLVTIGAGVVIWALWPTPKRVQQAAEDVVRRRRGERVEPVHVVLAEVVGTGADEPAEERDEDEAAEVEPDPEISEPTPDPAWWGSPSATGLTASPDEPTPIFSASGQYPRFEEQESFTTGWTRAEREVILRDIREEEARQAGVRAA